MKKYVADFETTTDENDIRVWAYSVVNIDTLEVEDVGSDIEGFINFISNKSTKVYFHNLKFDGEFILYYLLKNGFKNNDTKETGTFSTLISDTGEFYSIVIYFKKYNKRYKKCEILDSFKKLPFSVENIAKSFNLDICKLKIDHNIKREKGHIISDDERQYVINDSMIVAQALQIQYEKGLRKMTIGSDALNQYKESIKKVYFNKFFPVFDAEIDRDMRQAYKGGFTWLNPKYKNIDVYGIKYDVNSLYPSVMYDKLLPYGIPIVFSGKYVYDEDYPLYIQRIRCEFELKKGHIPTIQLKNNRAFIQTQYLSSSNGEIVDLTLSSVDMDLFIDHYDIYNLEYGNGYKFKACKGFFKDYINKWVKIKQTTEGAEKTIAKLMLNSLYGKFATNPIKANKYPYIEDDVVKYVTMPPTINAPVYVPMGIFITAYARDITIRTAQSVYHRFIYADTDSIHLYGYDEPKIKIHPSKLGYWKCEGKFTKGRYLRAKTYINTVDDHITITCAGMPSNVKDHVNYNNFKYGAVFNGKLLPVRKPGGILLTPFDFTIKYDKIE